MRRFAVLALLCLLTLGGIAVASSCVRVRYVSPATYYAAPVAATTVIVLPAYNVSYDPGTAAQLQSLRQEVQGLRLQLSPPAPPAQRAAPQQAPPPPVPPAAPQAAPQAAAKGAALHQQVVGIFGANHCAKCHTGAAAKGPKGGQPFILFTAEGTFNERAHRGKIHREVKSGAMPQGHPPLKDAEVDAIAEWVAEWAVE